MALVTSLLPFRTPQQSFILFPSRHPDGSHASTRPSTWQISCPTKARLNPPSASLSAIWCHWQYLCFRLTFDCVGKSTTRMFRFCAAATGSAFAMSDEPVPSRRRSGLLVIGRPLMPSVFLPGQFHADTHARLIQNQGLRPFVTSTGSRPAT